MPANRKRPFSIGWNLRWKNHRCHAAGTGHLPLRGVRGRADYEREAGGAGQARGDARAEGLGGREGVSG